MIGETVHKRWEAKLIFSRYGSESVDIPVGDSMDIPDTFHNSNDDTRNVQSVNELWSEVKEWNLCSFVLCHRR